MIHNNLRKVLRMCLRTNTSTYLKQIQNLTDITGYTGILGTDTLVNSSISSSFINASYTVSSKAYSSIKTQGDEIFYGFIGKSKENESDYSFGEFFTNSDLFKVTTTIQRDYEYIVTTTVVNYADNPIEVDELGLFLHIKGNDNTWNTDKNAAEFLLIKEKLETPITIVAGGSINFSFSLLADVVEEGS